MCSLIRRSCVTCAFRCQMVRCVEDVRSFVRRSRVRSGCFEEVEQQVYQEVPGSKLLLSTDL
jgi:hypothetical protein